MPQPGEEPRGMKDIGGEILFPPLRLGSQKGRVRFQENLPNRYLTRRILNIMGVFIGHIPGKGHFISQIQALPGLFV